MFIGRYYHTLENKGRLAIPKDFRASLESGAVLTRGLDGCLFVFPKSYWQQLTDKLASLPLTSSAARNFIRLIVQQAAPLELDSQGRTLIPDHLRQQAQLTKQVVVAGALTRLEIWDKATYHKHLEELEQTSPEVIKDLETLGI